MEAFPPFHTKRFRTKRDLQEYYNSTSFSYLFRARVQLCNVLRDGTKIARNLIENSIEFQLWKTAGK